MSVGTEGSGLLNQETSISISMRKFNGTSNVPTATYYVGRNSKDRHVPESSSGPNLYIRSAAAPTFGRRLRLAAHKCWQNEVVVLVGVK
jgi:hypothetical protein